jgi:two-component system, OmpR family, phosphate regulon response regulator OmpR
MATILIVDDEPLIIEMLGTFVRLLGHEVIEATSSRQARDRLAYLNPDMVLLDIMLPDTNGIDLCRELRANPANAELPIVMVSAHAPPMIDAAMEAGASGYLTKPVNMKSLRESFTTHLAKTV